MPTARTPCVRLLAPGLRSTVNLPLLPQANPWDFYPLNNWRDKKHDAVLFGSVPRFGRCLSRFPSLANPLELTALRDSFEGGFYPLRSTISRAIQDHTTSIVVRHPHPGPSLPSNPNFARCREIDLSGLGALPLASGYGVSFPDSAMTDPEESYDVTSPLHASHRAIRADFARGMREAKICVVRPKPSHAVAGRRSPAPG